MDTEIVTDLESLKEFWSNYRIFWTTTPEDIRDSVVEDLEVLIEKYKRICSNDEQFQK